MQTKDLSQEKIRLIRELFPNCVTESRERERTVLSVDFDALRQELSDSIVEGPQERYQFTWPDKSKAKRLANTPTTMTLRPCREESVDFDNTKNLYIEGDNLEVLKILRETYLGKVKMIYIDPPYNTGNDFVYNDNFSMSVEEYSDVSGESDDSGNRLFLNTSSNGRYHTNWLNMIYPRLLLAKDLLSENGVIFISIDNNELPNLWKICSEIFGESNFIECFPRVTKKAGKSSDRVSSNHDYLLSFSKSSFFVPIPEIHDDPGFKFEDKYVDKRGLYKLNQTLDYDSLQYSSSLDYPLEINGEIFYPGSSRQLYDERKRGNHARADWAWRWSRDLVQFGLDNDFIVVKETKNGKRIYTKTYQNAKIIKKGNEYEISYVKRTKTTSSLKYVDNSYSNDNAAKDLNSVFGFNAFDYSKPVSLLKDLIKSSTAGNDIIMDFFSGSGTVGEAVFAANHDDGSNRVFIAVQYPELITNQNKAFKEGYESIDQIGKERIRRVGETYNNINLGFRVFKCDSSNMKDVFYSPGGVIRNTLEDYVDVIKDNRGSEDLLIQVMLELGIELSSKIEQKNMHGHTIYSVDGGYLVACFDDSIDDSTIVDISKEMSGCMYAIFRSGSSMTDEMLANIEQIFKTYSPQTKIRIL